jgi:hypothetical protein
MPPAPICARISYGPSLSPEERGIAAVQLSSLAQSSYRPSGARSKTSV